GGGVFAANNKGTVTFLTGAGGDLAGALDNATVGRINGSPLGVTTAAAVGQVLKYDGAKWAPAADANSGGSVTSVATGNGLQGGPIVNAGTVDLRLHASGGLSK